MKNLDILIKDATIYDGTGSPPRRGDVGIISGRIEAVSDRVDMNAAEVVDGAGLALCPGFIDVHTHDDTVVIRKPDMRAKVSQGVTTVVVGNCGISASPVVLRGAPPDPMNLLGPASAFRYPRMRDYKLAIAESRPTVNVVALVGHTALRSNHLDDLYRTARPAEIQAMRLQLREAMEDGATGLSTGLAYASANAAGTPEVIALAEIVHDFGGVYTTHLRTEFAGIIDALDEAFVIGKTTGNPVIVSHLKCAGAGNWGRTQEVIPHLQNAQKNQKIGWDCYPYTAGSSTLDMNQVTDEFDILITWSEPYPEMAGKMLKDIASIWDIELIEAARRLRPAGAVYHNMREDDVRRVLSHPSTMIGSDGLPEDPLPHPRLWGTFPRVLGHYARDMGLFPLQEAVRKMTGLSAGRFGLVDRGFVGEGCWADLVLFDPENVRDRARFDDPIQVSEGIAAVWVNGILTYRPDGIAAGRAGRFIDRSSRLHQSFASV